MTYSFLLESLPGQPSKWRIYMSEQLTTQPHLNNVLTVQLQLNIYWLRLHLTLGHSHIIATMKLVFILKMENESMSLGPILNY